MVSFYSTPATVDLSEYSLGYPTPSKQLINILFESRSIASIELAMADSNPDFYNQTWDNGTDPFMWCFENPKSDLCDDVKTFYQYRVDLAPNAAFLAIFTLSFISFVVTWVITRVGTAFNVALLLGLICEILGYAGRIMSWQNPWSENGFLIQICCLTIGPAFMAAGIYLCLRRIVSAFGPENSRLPPEYYTRIVRPFLV